MPDERKESAAIAALEKGRIEDAVRLFRDFNKTTGFCDLGLCANRDAEWECCANHFQGRLLTLSLATEEPAYYELSKKLRAWIKDRRAREGKKKEIRPARVKLPGGLFIGHPSIDFDHMKLVSVLNDIADALDDGNFANFSTLLNNFLELEAMHFKREEEIMAAVSFPELSAHCEVHNRLRDKAAGLIKRAAKIGRNKAAQEHLLSELVSILFDDAMQSDLMFKAFLHRKERLLL